MNKSNELKLCEVSQNSFSNRCWKFQFPILKNKKDLFLKIIFFCSQKSFAYWLNFPWRFWICLPIKQVKVEKILKSSLDSISSPSPAVKIQIIGGKVCLGREGKTLLGIVHKKLVLTLYFEIFPRHTNNR